MEFRETEEFKKEFKGLKRKYQTLEADLAVLKKTIAAQPSGDASKHWNRLATCIADLLSVETLLLMNSSLLNNSSYACLNSRFLGTICVSLIDIPRSIKRCS